MNENTNCEDWFLREYKKMHDQEKGVVDDWMKVVDSYGLRSTVLNHAKERQVKDECLLDLLDEAMLAYDI